MRQWGGRSAEAGKYQSLAAYLGADVTLSDLERVLPIARHNAGLNPPVKKAGTIRVEELLWGQDVRQRFRRGQFDVILGADLTYADHLQGPLIATLLQLASEGTEVLLAHRWRPNDDFSLWRRRFQRYMNVELLDAEDEVAGYSAVGLDLPADWRISIFRLTWVGPPPHEEDLSELFRCLNANRAGDELLTRLNLRVEDLDVFEAEQAAEKVL